MIKAFRSVLLTAMLLFLTACHSFAKSTSDEHEIIKSPNDPREFRYLKLANGIQLALVFSPETRSSAIAVNIHVGSEQDPDEWPGLAHLLEHMLFLGSDKYPGADKFDSFITDHGGYTNAWTASDDTVYYLTIPNQNLSEALDRLSQFFIAPKLDQKYLDRERHAVDSEFQIYRQQDARRFSHIENVTSNPDHPGSRFTTGNLETLNDHNGLSLREALLEFHKTWYTGPNISIAIVGHSSLDELEQLVRKLFTPVLTAREPPRRANLPPRFTQDQLSIRIDSVAQQQMRNLSLEFYLPPDPDALYTKSLPYIANLLGHEAKGSLANVLKDKGWIQDLVTYNQDNTKEASLTVEMNLTKEGFKYIEEITGQVFAYLKLIHDQGISPDRYEELQKEYQLSFRFLGQGLPEDTALNLASRMPLLPPKELMRAGFLYQTFDAAAIKRYIGQITPDNMRMRVASQALPPVNKSAIQVEPWTGAQYSVQKLTEEQKNLWLAAQPDPSLLLPPANPFMPENLNLVEEETTDHPEKINVAPGFSGWFLHSSKYQAPRTNIIMRLASPEAVNTPEDVVRMSLFLDLFNRAFTETAYMASLAGLDYSLWQDYRGFYIQVFGFNDRLSTFLFTLLPQLRNLKVDPLEFEKEKEAVEESLINRSQHEPGQQVFETMRKVLYSYEFQEAQLQKALDETTVQNLQEWVNSLFSKISLTTFIHGNITREAAESINEKLSELVAGPDSNSFVNLPKAVPMNPDQPVCYISYKNSDSAILIVSQSEKRDHQTRAVYRLLSSILATPYFTQLRTNEQLGYSVWSEIMEQKRFPSIVFGVQSPSALPTTLDERISAFLTEFNETVSDLTEKSLQSHKEGIITALQETGTNLASVSWDYWNDIDSGYPGFDQDIQLIKAIQKVTVADIQELYKQILSGKKQFKVYGYTQEKLPEDPPPACNDPEFMKQFISR